MINSIKDFIERMGRKRFIIYSVVFILLAANIIGAALMLAANRQPIKGERQYQQLSAAAHKGSTLIDFDMLREQNPDVCAWLISEGTGIDYPIVQGENDKFYRSHLFSGKSNRLGCLYIDSRCANDFSGRNTVIYGGKQLDSIYKYFEQDYYELLPYMTIITPEGSRTILLYAGVRTDSIEDAIKTEFADSKEFNDYISWLGSNSCFSSNISINESDSIVTICASDGREGFVLVGKAA